MIVRRGENKEVWAQIISAKREYDCTPYPQLDFYDWLERTYGIKLTLTPRGEMNLDNEITDDQKYLIFMLKHGGR